MVNMIDAEAFKYVAETVKRGKATWVLGKPPQGVPVHNVAMLVCGAPKGIVIADAGVVSIGLTRASLLALRDLANDILGTVHCPNASCTAHGVETPGNQEGVCVFCKAALVVKQ